MPINVVLSKAHQKQLDDVDVAKEKDCIQKIVNNNFAEFHNGTVNFFFVKGIYNHSERKMMVACLFVNKTDYSINEIHSVLRLKFKFKKAEIAKATINFDKDFIGKLNTNDALLVHINIPVKGLDKDEEFTISDIEGKMDSVRFSKSESDN